MRTAVPKDELIGIIKANREVHIADFQDAWKAFIERVLSDVEAFKARVNLDQAPKHWSLNWTAPESHEEDYDRALGMLDLSVDEAIILDEADVDRYIYDDWDWKQRFQTTNSFYTGR